MNPLTNLVVLAEETAIGNPVEGLRPKAVVSAVDLGDSIRPTVHISQLDPSAYPASVGKHADRVQIRRTLGDRWAYCRVVGDPDDDPIALLQELIDALEEYAR